MPLEDRGASLSRTGEHPDAERLAEYVDNVLAPGDRTSVEQHLAVCEDCRDVVGDAGAVAHQIPATVRSQPAGPLRSRWMLGAVAGLAAAAVLILVVRGTRPESPSAALEGLVAAVQVAPTRPLESRLTPFRHAPPPPVTRGGSLDASSPDIRIAAATVERASAGRSDAASAAAMGVAHAVVGELDAAVADLERAVEDEPTNVTWLTDLSAVYIARGRRDSRSADYEAAVVAAGRALGADASLPAACFNRALALEALARGGEARTMWERCLTIEDDSQWAAEIRTHLAAR